MYAHCARRLRSAADADDATQQTFIYAMRSLDRGVMPEHEAAWLTAIADNVCRASLRRACRRREIGDELDDVAAPESPREHVELARELTRAVGRLTPAQRQALLMREWHGLSYREIAGHLEVSEAAVETLLFRARRKLISLVDEGRTAARRALDLGSLSGLGRLIAGALGKGGAVAAAGTVAVVATATAVVPHQSAPRPLPHSAKPTAAAPVSAAPEATPPTRVGLPTRLPHGRRYRANAHESVTTLRRLRNISSPASPPVSQPDPAAPSQVEPAPAPTSVPTPAPKVSAAPRVAAPAVPLPVPALPPVVDDAAGAAVSTVGDTAAQATAPATAPVAAVVTAADSATRSIPAPPPVPKISLP